MPHKYFDIELPFVPTFPFRTLLLHTLCCCRHRCFPSMIATGVVVGTAALHVTHTHRYVCTSSLVVPFCNDKFFVLSLFLILVHNRKLSFRYVLGLFFGPLIMPLNLFLVPLAIIKIRFLSPLSIPPAFYFNPSFLRAYTSIRSV